MMDRRCGIVAAILFFSSILADPVLAQRGALIEDLFRTWAESQISRESTTPTTRPNPAPQRVPTPVPQRAPLRSRTVPSPSPRLGSAWNSLHDDLGLVLEDLRATSSRQASLRCLVPDAYQLAARTDQLQRMATGTDAQRLAEVYPDFDRDYRQFSFAVRSAPGVSEQSRSLVSRCDQTVNRLGRYYSVAPQWNRERFADVVVMGQANLQSLMDDLSIVSTGTKQYRHLHHDLQQLAVRLTSLRPNLSRLSYDQVAAEFNQFSAAMLPLAREIRLMRNPHLDMRLDRLRELADESYGLLWMPPPINQTTLLESAIRIEQAADELRDQLDSRALRNLPSDSRRAIEDSVRTIDRKARRLADEMRHHPGDDSIPGMLQQIDASALDLSRRIGYVPGLHHASLTTIRDETSRLLAVMRIPPSQNVLDYDELRRLASTLEGSSEYLREDIRRYQRYVNPASYRSDLMRGADDLFRAARDFHQGVDDRRELEDLLRRRDQLLDAWSKLDSRVVEMGSYGVPPSSVAAIMRYRNAMLEPIAGVAAMLGAPASQDRGRTFP